MARNERRRYKRLLNRDFIRRITPNSLLFYSANIHSQRGQDGILAEVFRRLGIGTGTFVEFGAWDGVYLSNCRYLFEKGWKGVFIEADRERYHKLTRVYADVPDVVTINALVGAPRLGLGRKNLAQLLEESGVNTNTVTFVSIDVDGLDLELFSDLGVKPPVVLLEGGFNWSPYFDRRVGVGIARQNMQQPLPTIVRTVCELGYSPVCFYQDTYLVRCDLAVRVSSCVNDAVALYRDAYFFMNDEHRERLISIRATSGIIRELEREYFGFFDVDPLAYSELAE